MREIGTHRWDVLLGAEIACLKREHEALVKTIDRLADDQTVVLLTFDESLVDSSGVAYKREFIERMNSHGFHHTPLLDGDVTWSRQEVCASAEPMAGKEGEMKSEYRAVLKTKAAGTDSPVSSSSGGGDVSASTGVEVSTTRHHLEAFFRAAHTEQDDDRALLASSMNKANTSLLSLLVQKLAVGSAAAQHQ